MTVSLRKSTITLANTATGIIISKKIAEIGNNFQHSNFNFAY